MLKTPIVHEQKPLTSNQQATLQIPVYGKIYSSILRFTVSGTDASVAAIKAQIGQIRLTINGKDVVNATATKLFDVQSALGQYVNAPSGTAGVIELNLGRLLFNNPLHRDAFGFGTDNITSIQVSVTAGTLTTITDVQAFTTRTSERQNLGVYCKLINYPQSFNSTGDHTVDTLPRDPDSAYLAVFAEDGASGTQTFGEVRVNNVTIKERQPRAVNEQIMSSDRFSQPAGYFCYMFTDGDPTSLLPMQGVSDLRFINTFSVAPGAAGYDMTSLTMVGLPASK